MPNGKRFLFETQKIMNAIIAVSAPTTYQLSSIRAFKLNNFKSLGNGSHISWQEFESEDDAREYLSNLASDYYEDDQNSIDRNLSENGLRLDACSAEILTGQDMGEYLESVA